LFSDETNELIKFIYFTHRIFFSNMENFFRNFRIIVLTYDIGNNASFETMRSWFAQNGGDPLNIRAIKRIVCISRAAGLNVPHETQKLALEIRNIFQSKN
jgi:hypothetical protein